MFDEGSLRREVLVQVGGDEAKADEMLLAMGVGAAPSQEGLPLAPGRIEAAFALPGEPVDSLVSRYFSGAKGVDLATGLRDDANGAQVLSAALASDCDFIHYSCHGEGDTGWGCCYRALQMILTHLLKAGLVDLETVAPSRTAADIGRQAWPPRIEEIQRRLVWCATHLTHKGWSEKHVGSERWIEPPECAAVVRSLGVPCDELLFRTTEGPAETEATLADFERRLFQHFSTGPRTPIVVDDITYAYAVAGICTVVQEEAAAAGEALTLLLLFDPHATGRMDLEAFRTGDAAWFQSTAPPEPKGPARWVPFRRMMLGSKTWMVALPGALVSQEGGGQEGGGAAGADAAAVVGATSVATAAQQMDEEKADGEDKVAHGATAAG